MVDNNFNWGISTSGFPTALKMAEVKPVFKITSRNNKTNYRPVSLLLKYFRYKKDLIYKQVPGYFEPILSKYQCGFWKGYSALNYLLVMVEKWKKCFNRNGTCGAFLTNLSKAFIC